jgi:single-strand DNA-binding protein
MDQKIELRGTVTRDPEMKTTASGKTFMRMSVAADEVARDGESLDPKTNKWHTVLAWSNENEVRKGDQVRVAGQHVMRGYEDQAGTQKVASEIHNATVEVLQRGRASDGIPIEAAGTVVRDPELKTTDSGKVLTRITIVASEVKMDGKAVDAEANKWQTAVFWDQEAEDYARTVKKGAELRFTGEFVTREYTDREGTTRTAGEIRRASLEVVTRAKGEPEPATGEGKPASGLRRKDAGAEKAAKASAKRNEEQEVSR